MNRRKLEILRIQETKWKGGRARILAGGYKIELIKGNGAQTSVPTEWRT